MIKEFREFFLRHSIVNSGAKKDQEIAFPLQYYIDGKLKYNRFLKGDYPSEAVFKKFLESVTFKLNPEDTALTTLQGLVKAATDVDAIAQTETFTDLMTRAVMPYQLPTVEANPSAGNVVITITPVVKGLSGGRTRRSWRVKGNYTGTVTAPLIALLYSHPDEEAIAGGGTSEDLLTYTLPADTLVAKGDLIVVETYVRGFSNAVAPPSVAATVLFSGNQNGGIWFVPTLGKEVKVIAKFIVTSDTTLSVENVSIPITGQNTLTSNANMTGIDITTNQDVTLRIKSLVNMTAGDVTIKNTTVTLYRL